MKKIVFLLLIVSFQLIASAAEILKDIQVGGIFFVDNEGYIYTNSDEHSITRYSPTGELLSTMGKKGEGPSDIKRLGGFSINPLDNNIYVTEFYGGNKWISKFSTGGKYLGEWNCELDWKKCEGISYIKFDGKGNIYLKTNHSLSGHCKDFVIGNVEDTITKFSPHGKKLREIYHIKTALYVEKGGKGNLTIPFSNSLYYTVYNDNIIIRESQDDFVQVFDLEGTLQKKISLPFRKEKVTQEDIDTWEKRIRASAWGKRGMSEGWLDLNYWKTRLPFPDYKPVSGYPLLIDSQGNLYNMKYPGMDDTSIKCARINLSNGEITILNFKSGESLLAAWKNYFFIQKEDEDDDYVILKIEEKEYFSRK
ncbi:MAG TPA: hypothetical protein VK469_11040 [Candidatus Kapabacteria bacterium]|nr:hypothetical protein [Candidatus Kapabacteria bacterium]